MSAAPAPLPAPAATLGEGPCWDTATGSLYWVDIPASQVHRLDGDGAHRSWDVGQPVGAVVVRSSGGLMLAARDGFLTLDPATGDVAPLVALDLPEGCRMNVGACDEAALWGGGAVLRFDPGGGLRHSLELPRVTAYALGGPDLETLYITAASGPAARAGSCSRPGPG